MLTSLCAPCLAEKTAGTVYYFDSVSGDDGNDGKTPDTAFESIGKLSSIEAQPGDEFLFRAGCVFDGYCELKMSGTAENGITVSSYGDIATDGCPLFSTLEAMPVFNLVNCNYLTIENLEITALNGGGIMALAYEQVSTDITVKNCSLHNISNSAGEKGKMQSPVYINAMGFGARFDNVTLSGLSVRDCAYGVQMSGANVETSPENFVSAEESYSRNIIVEDCIFSDILNDGVIFASVNGGAVRNCSFISTCLLSESYTAPVWMHHVNGVTVEKCEVAGTLNKLDGMTVDFDGWTTNSTYQYIYSHDNTRFIKNCCFESVTSNSGNTVRYCLSVNDNRGMNMMVFCGLSGGYDYSLSTLPTGMRGFKFYNNTLVNCSRTLFFGLKDSIVANNIFCGKYADFLGLNFGARQRKWFSSTTGTVTNNCFCGTVPLVTSSASLFCDPGFDGDDNLDPSSYMLCRDSKLIGAGIQVEEDMGETDFFGNPLTSVHNIGCYEGQGTDNECGERPFFALFAK